jgi:hypothetical protein
VIDGDIETAFPLAVEAVRNFYQGTSATDPEDCPFNYFSNVIDVTKVRTQGQFFDGDWQTSFDITEDWSDRDERPESNASLPLEVSACLSFKGTLSIDGTAGPSEAGRRRGRVYLGPLQTRVNTNASDKTPTISTNFRDACTGAAAFFSNSNLDLNIFWVVWSPTAGDATRVHEGWMDDDFDTQRRRGEDATARTTFTNID